MHRDRSRLANGIQGNEEMARGGDGQPEDTVLACMDLTHVAPALGGEHTMRKRAAADAPRVAESVQRTACAYRF